VISGSPVSPTRDNPPKMPNKSFSAAPTKTNGRKGYASKRDDYKPRHKASKPQGQSPRTRSARPVFEKQERFESSEQHQLFDTFQQMDLPERITQELAKLGAVTPFPIQAATIPAAIEGKHVLGRGKTGSGKTIAFGVPLVVKLAAGGNQTRVPGKPRALVIAPTRELAEQINKTLSRLPSQ